MSAARAPSPSRGGAAAGCVGEGRLLGPLRGTASSGRRPLGSAASDRAAWQNSRNRATQDPGRLNCPPPLVESASPRPPLHTRVTFLSPSVPLPPLCTPPLCLTPSCQRNDPFLLTLPLLAPPLSCIGPAEALPSPPSRPLLAVTSKPACPSQSLRSSAVHSRSEAPSSATFLVAIPLRPPPLLCCRRLGSSAPRCATQKFFRGRRGQSPGLDPLR